jgi:hypothetical protein
MNCCGRGIPSSSHSKIQLTTLTHHLHNLFPRPSLPNQYDIWVELHPNLGEYPEDGESFIDIAKAEKLIDEIETRLLNGEDFGEVLGESGIV